MDLENSIRKIVERRGLKMDFVYNSIEMTASGFYKMLRNNSIKVDVLEKIAATLEIPPSYFFATEDEQNKILDGKKSTWRDDLATLIVGLGTAYLYVTTLNQVTKILEKIKTNRDYSRDEIEVDLKETQSAMVQFIEMYDFHNTKSNQ